MKRKPLVIHMTASELYIGGVRIVSPGAHDRELMIVMMKRHLNMEMD